MATDARRREVYWARYDADGRRLDGPAVGFPADVAETVVTEQTAGQPGHPDRGRGRAPLSGRPGRAHRTVHPAAGTLAGIAARQLAAGEPGSGAEPIYLRRPDARVPGPPKRVTVP